MKSNRGLDSQNLVKVAKTRFAFFTGKRGVGKTSLAYVSLYRRLGSR
jgi:putative ribosome biogenesis GTPase RsgA